MQHKIKYLRTETRAVNLLPGAIVVIEDASTYRGQMIYVSYTDRAPDDLCIEARTNYPVAHMDGFDTLKEAMLWIDAQLGALDDVADDMEGDWMAYREEHSLRSWQLV